MTIPTASQARAETAASMKDTVSRYMLQTTTKTGEWDQVTGVSQGTINQNFENLFKLNPKMAVMDRRVGKARINAKLLAPRIIIPAGVDGKNTSGVLFLLRFASGTMVDNEGTEIIDNLQDWVIAFSVQLDKFSDNPALNPPIEDEFQQGVQQKHVQSLRSRLRVNGKQLPGKYSVERLYANLSSADFGQPNMTYSKAVVDGQVISWSAWASKNFDAYVHLRNFIEKWAMDQDNEGHNICGFSIQVKDGIDPQKPTYEPTDLVHQAYAYKQNDICKTGSTGDNLLGSRNAFLYCEMTDGAQRPDDYAVTWSGNFCTMPSTPDAKDAIEGTFIMSRKLFMEKFLLLKLRQLNQASEVCHGLPYGQQSDLVVSCPMPYNVSYDPANPTLQHTCYDYTNLNPENRPDMQNGYQFKKINAQPRNDSDYIEFKNTKGSGANLKSARVRDVTEVNVTWTAGSPELFVKGTITSEEIAYWDQGGDLKPGDPSKWDMKDIWAFVTDKFVGSWEMKITLKTSPLPPHNNGVLDVDIDCGTNNDCKIELKRDPNSKHHNMDENGHMEGVLADLKARFSNVVPEISKAIRESVQGSGRFFFPGSGVFAFSKPAFTKWGDLVAIVDYLPLDAGKLILIPEPAQEENIPPPSTKTQVQVMAAPVGAHSLTWTSIPEPCTLSSNTRGKMVFRGINNQKGNVGLQEIRVLFTAKKKANNLFYVDKLFAHGSEPTPPPPKQADDKKGGVVEKDGKNGDAAEKKGNPTTTTNPEKVETGDTSVDTADKSAVSTDVSGSKTSTVQTTSTESSGGDTTKSDKLPAGASNDSNAGSVSSSAQTGPAVETKASDSVIPPFTATVGPSQTDATKEQDDGPQRGGTQEGGLLNKLKETARAISDFLPSGEPDFGVVTLNTNVKDAKHTLKVKCQNAAKFETAAVGKWQVTIDDVDNTLYFKPGEWIEVVIDARANMPGVHNISIDEEFIDTGGAHWSEDYPVRIR